MTVQIPHGMTLGNYLANHLHEKKVLGGWNDEAKRGIRHEIETVFDAIGLEGKDDQQHAIAVLVTAFTTLDKDFDPHAHLRVISDEYFNKVMAVIDMQEDGSDGPFALFQAERAFRLKRTAADWVFKRISDYEGVCTSFVGKAAVSVNIAFGS